MPRWPSTRVLRPAEGKFRWLRAGSPAWADPMALIAAFTLGALLLLQLPSLPDARWFLLALPLIFLRGPYRWLLIAGVLGAFITGLRAQAVIDLRWPVSRVGEELTVRGTVSSLPQGRLDASGGDEAIDDRPPTRTWRFLFAPDDPTLPTKIRVAWYRSDAQPRGGECWQLRLKLRTPHGSLNPGGFDYEGWLFRQGIGATATVRSAEPCGEGSGYRLLRWRQQLSDRFAEWLPGHPGLQLVSALAIGDTSALDDEDWQDFRLTGTTHLIAISGFNVAIIAGVAFFLVRWLWVLSPGLCLRLPAQRAASLGSAVSALLYAMLAGFDPPVERAAFMLLFLLGAGWFGGFTQASRALAVAWFAIVVSDPLALLTPGLWLSFGAVAAIFFVSSGRLGKRSAWREALRVQWMLSLMLAPLAFGWFQGTSLIGPLVNLVAVPITAVLTPALLISLLLAWLVPMVGIPALRFIATVLAKSASGLGWIADHAPQAWISAGPEPVQIALAVIGAVLLFAPTGLPLRVLGALCFAALAWPPKSGPSRGFELTALDVGQGTAIVIRTSHHTLLFDAGPAFPGGLDAGRAVVVPYLLKTGVRRLDRLIVSHRDLDHRGGVPAVRELIRVDEEIGALVPEHGCVAGETWIWDDVRFEILNGPAEGLSENDGGCVLMVTSPELTALLPADIEALGEARLLASGVDLKADVLLAPHHGSKTSSSAAFIEAVWPSVVIHSAGWHHRFGHPSPGVVARYAEVVPEATQLNTATSGAVIVQGPREAMQIKRWRVEAQRAWTVVDDPTR